MFAEVVAQVDREPEPENKEPTESGAKPGTETPETPETEAAPANDLSPEEQQRLEAKAEELGLTLEEVQAQEAAEAEAGAGAGETVDLSQLEPEVAEALKGLNGDAQKHLIEIAQAVANGETTIGQVKRQFKLGKAENEELQTLRQRVQELEARPPVAAASNVPPSVAKLKTVEEVEARTEQLQDSVQAIEDFLDENPNGGQIGEQEFTRAQLVQRKRGLQEELRALPKQAQALQATARLTQEQATVRAGVVKDFPYYADETNPDAKLAREMIQGTPAIKAFPNMDYLALALARGHRELQAEKTKRAAGRLGAAAKAGVQASRPGVKPGVVAAAKPHTAVSAATKAPTGGKPVGELVKNVKDKDSFAALLEATGR